MFPNMKSSYLIAQGFQFFVKFAPSFNIEKTEGIMEIDDKPEEQHPGISLLDH